MKRFIKKRWAVCKNCFKVYEIDEVDGKFPLLNCTSEDRVETLLFNGKSESVKIKGCKGRRLIIETHADRHIGIDSVVIYSIGDAAINRATEEILDIYVKSKLKKNAINRKPRDGDEILGLGRMEISKRNKVYEALDDSGKNKEGWGVANFIIYWGKTKNKEYTEVAEWLGLRPKTIRRWYEKLEIIPSPLDRKKAA